MSGTLELYTFKVTCKYKTKIWRRIEIPGKQTLGDFDIIIREAFEYDKWDHLSEFFPGRAWACRGFGEIEPGGKSRGTKKKIEEIQLVKGDIIEYIYDFGDDLGHKIKLEKISVVEKSEDWPRVIGRNKPKYQFCEECMKEDRKTVATWICLECSDKEQRDVLLCEDCLMKKHEEHYAEKILY